MTKQKAQTNPYDRYRALAYENVANRNEGRILGLEDVVDEIVALGNGTDVESLRRAAAWEAAMREDKLRTSPPPFIGAQPTLFGWPDAEDAFWKLGEGVRVRVREAKRRDHLTHLRLMEENERSVIDSARQTRERYYQLLPYYLAGAETVADAVAAFKLDEERRAEVKTGDLMPVGGGSDDD